MAASESQNEAQDRRSDVVVREQREISVYLNEDGNVVISQPHPFADTAYITIVRANVQAVIDALVDLA